VILERQVKTFFRKKFDLAEIELSEFSEALTRLKNSFNEGMKIYIDGLK